MCWPKSPQSVKRFTGQCLRRKCIQNIHGLRNQPLFFAIFQSCDSNNCSKVSFELVPHGPCGGEAAGAQMRVCHSLNLILRPGLDHFPLCSPFPEIRASFGAGLSLTGADGDVWAVPVAVPRTIPGVAAASRVWSTSLAP